MITEVHLVRADGARGAACRAARRQREPERKEVGPGSRAAEEDGSIWGGRSHDSHDHEEMIVRALLKEVIGWALHFLKSWLCGVSENHLSV